MPEIPRLGLEQTVHAVWQRLSQRNPSKNFLRRAVLTVGVCLPLLVQAAGFMEHEVSFSEAEVQAMVNKASPLEKRYGELIALSMPAAPLITLGRPQAGRVGLALHAEIKWLGQPAVPLDVLATAGVRYDDQQKAFFLNEPQIDSLESAVLTPDIKPLVRRALNQWLVNYYRKNPVHVLRDNASAQESTARWLLRDLRIETGKVVAVLSPL